MAANGFPDLEEIWPDLEAGLQDIYNMKGISVNRSMELYNHVHNICTRVNVPVGHINQRANNRVIGSVEAELYKRISIVIANNVESIKEECKLHSGESLLRYFTSKWAQFTFCSRVIDRVTGYLNRYWIRRARGNGQISFQFMYTLCLITWKQMLHEQMEKKVAATVLNLIEQERNGSVITTSLVKGVVDCFVELGIDEAVDAPDDSAMLKVYREMLESKFFIATENFYTAEAASFISANPISEYMKRVERRLNEESDRCAKYLHPASVTPLISKCNEVLISEHLDLFWSEFCNLLESERDEDLARMYRLCERVGGGLDKMAGILEEHIKKQGLSALEKVKAQAATDPKVFVLTLFEVQNRYAKLVSEACKNEIGFVQALDEAAIVFINENCVTLGVGLNAQNNAKGPQILARYCDSLLRSSQNNDDSEMDESLNQVVTIFKYLDDKDVFQHFYTKMLARRLVRSISASNDAEDSMIGKLKHTCGFAYTTRMESMLKDMRHSKEMTERFKNEDNYKSLGCDFNAMILGSFAWPSLGSAFSINLPHKLSQCVAEFSAFYDSIHMGRKLIWKFSHSKGELVAHGFSRRYAFAAMVPQMAILLLFNGPTEMDGASMLAQLQMKREQLAPQLTSLVKAEILKVTEGDVADLDENTKVALNLKYSSKKIKVDLSKFLVRGEAKEDAAVSQHQVEEARKIMIQAAIVRIMKTRRHVAHSMLITEVINHLNARFKPLIQMIKKCIEILIEKQYLARVDGLMDTYKYIA